MFDSLVLLDIVKNPAILAIIFAIIRNIGGYIYNCFEAKKLLPYSIADFLVTLGICETFFILLGGVASLDTNSVAVVTVIVDVIRSFRQALTAPKTPVS